MIISHNDQDEMKEVNKYHIQDHIIILVEISSLNSPDEYAKKMRVIKFLKGELRCGSYDIQDIVMMSAVHDDYSIVKMVFRMNLVSRKYKILKLIYRKKQN
eukprot:378037_1